MSKLPVVYCSNNVDTPLGLIEEFPKRVGVLLTPGHWQDPSGVPYVLDNGRYSAWSMDKKWNEKAFIDLLEQAKQCEVEPRWVVVPDWPRDAERTLADWNEWYERVKEYGWPLALVVQKGMTSKQVKKLDNQPDVIFVGGDEEWRWKYARDWCDNFPNVHFGKIMTEKQLWMVQKVGGESSDSNVWRPVGNHLKVLRKYLRESDEGIKRYNDGLFEKEIVEPQSEETKEEIRISESKVKAQTCTDKYSIYNGDCVQVLPSIPDGSVGFSIFSPPFADLYAYSDDDEDMGNCGSYDGFFEHFKFLSDELFRVLMPGRVVAIHCMDLPTQKRNGDEIGMKDFSGDIVRLFVGSGFTYHSRHCIWKDPLDAAFRTKAIGLAHKQIVKDSALCRMGIPDYILAFRKPGENPKPISNVNGLTEYHGERSIPNDLDRFLGGINPLTNEPWKQKENKRSHWIWQQYASPVWFDIRQTKVLGFRNVREEDDEKHICLEKGSLVLTKERGYIPIQDVKIGENALTHMGRWRPVLAVQKIGMRESVIVRGQGIPGLVLTPDHKLWIRKTDWVRQREGAERIAPTWIGAKDSIGGYANLKLPEETIPSVNDAQIWWIVGRWLADGHWDSRGGIHISSGYHKTESTLQHMGDYAGFIHDSGTSHQIRIKDRGMAIREILSRCGLGAADKRIPPEAYTLPKVMAKSLLDGYLSGDGYFLKSRGRWMACSVSKNLLMGMAFLIQRVFESIASIRASRPERIGNIQGRKVHCKQLWDLSFDIPTEGKYKKQFIIEDGAWKKIRTINDAGIREVWNIRVEEDESFTAEGCIVKNCPLQLDTIQRCMALWSAPDDVVLTPFMGIGSEVYVAVKNGRKGIGIELKGRYYRQAIKHLKGLERLLEGKKGFGSGESDE